MNFSKKVKVLLSIILILFISIPVTLALLQKQQKTQSSAAPTTTLSLIPQPGPANSITKNKNDEVLVDIKLDPGSNMITTLRIQISYDQNKLQLDATHPFDLTEQPPNSPYFLTPIQIPPANGRFSIILTTGDSAGNAIQSPITVGTLKFKAIDTTGDNPVQIATTQETQIYAIDAPARENVLKSHPPAEITIKGNSAPPPGPGTKLSATVLLDGMGIAGDTTNRTANDLSNKNPQNPERTLKVFVYNTSHQQVATGAGIISYVEPDEQDNDDNVGKFMGTVTLDKIVPNGEYKLLVQSDRYLRKTFLSNITIDNSIETPLPSITLVAGDTNGDNFLNIDDYNALRDCGFGALNPLPLTNPHSEYHSDSCSVHIPISSTDLNDDGTVNAFDYNLFIRELSAGQGDN